MTELKEEIYTTECGDIHYWISKTRPEDLTLVFLPGFSCSHRLFEKQISHFSERCNIVAWDPPGHVASYPFTFTFTMKDKARWLKEILEKESLTNLVLIGNSMGGYVSQVFLSQYPELNLKGFISIDSSCLQREYVAGIELFIDKWIIKPICWLLPWSLSKKSGYRVTNSDAGRLFMLENMEEYGEDKTRFTNLAGHCMNMLAEAYESNFVHYPLPCLTLLICGEQDSASFIEKNKLWSKDMNLPLIMIPNAGHIANYDEPEVVNTHIDEFLKQIN